MQWSTGFSTYIEELNDKRTIQNGSSFCTQIHSFTQTNKQTSALEYKHTHTTRSMATNWNSMKIKNKLTWTLPSSTALSWWEKEKRRKWKRIFVSSVSNETNITNEHHGQHRTIDYIKHNQWISTISKFQISYLVLFFL